MNLEKAMLSQAIPAQNQISAKRSVSDHTTIRTKFVEKVSLHNDKAVNAEAREIETIVEKLNGFIDPSRTNLKFVFHEQLNEYYVTVIDPITNETIKEIPSKKMLDFYASMAEFMGILIDQKI